MKEFTNLWTALVTPYQKDLSIDFEALEGLLYRQEAAGSGVVLFGSTGEGLALTCEEKERVLSFTCSLKLTLPIMVGVGGFQLAPTLEWLRFCEKMPIEAYLMVTPIYSKPGVRGQVEWFRALMDHVTRPCIFYHIPSRAGCPLLAAAVGELKEHPCFFGIKDSSSSLNDYYAFVEAAPQAAMYSGEDVMMPYLAQAGAAGLISVVSNVWPGATKRYVQDCLSGKQPQPLSLWHKACSSMFASSNPGPLKALLYDKGWIKTPFLRPPLSHLDVGNLEALKQWDSKIAQWAEH